MAWYIRFLVIHTFFKVIAQVVDLIFEIIQRRVRPFGPFGPLPTSVTVESAEQIVAGSAEYNGDGVERSKVNVERSKVNVDEVTLSRGKSDGSNRYT